MNVRRFCVVAALATAGLAGPARAALILQLQAANYDATTGTWTAAVGSNATQATVGDRPSLATGQTGNGSAVVRFDGTDFLTLTTAVPVSQTYTVFAYVRPTDIGTTRTIVAGPQGSLHYRFNGDETQTLNRQNQAALGTSTTAASVVNFNSVNVTADAAGATVVGSFRVNGSAAGAINATTTDFTAGINGIGAHTQGTPGERFNGDIAEIRIYDTAMTDTERQAVETELSNTYVPEPASLGLLGVGAMGLLARRRRTA